MDVLVIRKSLGMTQAEFAQAIGVDKSVVYKYEHGLLSPSKRRQKIIEQLISPEDKDDTSYEDSNSTEIRMNGYIRRLLVSGANGLCELCGNEAPFMDKEGRPYLKPYMVNKSENDVVRCYVVLCPNCFDKIKVLSFSDDIELLKKKASDHNY